MLIIQVHDIPNAIDITVVEKSPKLDAKILANIGVPLPDEASFSRVNRPLDTVEFAYNSG